MQLYAKNKLSLVFKLMGFVKITDENQKIWKK